MLPYKTAAAASAAIGRNLTAAESLWLRYSATAPDFLLYSHNIVFLLIVYALAPLPLSFISLYFPNSIRLYKIQPNATPLSPATVLLCFRRVVATFLLTVGPLQIFSFPAIRCIGIRTGLPLPSGCEMAAQIAVYFVVEDFLHYWIHRGLHTRWGYDRIHRVHHEFRTPMGYAAPYAHWAEVVALGMPAFVGPAAVPGHIVTFWLWMVIRHVEAIETHCGYDFPHTPTKYIPFYCGAEYHDFHHYVGGQTRCNFASIFTYCDYIYGTDKGYRYHKSQL
ncbi:Methylsterol monooxygenase 1-1 [Apostasia shenzhenica]|uniref:aldehyde oxygenase (deformylating) n=1 Tax=Apostasia shenzhenica TaxID=1088818 RepID=A0A2I0AWW4_9ASPA|nr:Methylsterol monooxygenase 1-1 [Apostasia shenzhenica]